MAILINDVSARIQYTATSGQTVFTVPFEFFENSDLKVYQNNTLLTIATHYTVAGAGVTGGGTVTFVTGATADDTISIVRDVPVKRVTDFPVSGPFNINGLNEDLDRLTAMVQQQETRDNRTLRIADEDTPAVFNAIPTKANRAGKSLGFDSAGQPVVFDTNVGIGASFTIDSISNLFDSVQTQFVLESNGTNLGDSVNDDAFWIVAINGVIQTEGVDFSISLDSNDIARIVFTTAPETNDSFYGVFIRLYEGDVTAGVIGGGSGGGGDEGDATSYIEITTSNPATGSYDGQTIYNTTDGAIYIWNASTSEWLDIFQTFTPDAPDAITVVSSLPGSGTAGQVVYLSTDEKLYEWDAGSSQWVAIVLTNDTSATVADGSITTAKFAQGITPVEIVATLPSSGNFEGRMAYLTTDNKLYRYEGATWTAAVAGSDLTGSVDGSLLTANSIAAGVIQAGAISATELAANAVSTAKLAAGAVTTDKITANAVIADKIAANAVTSDKIIANAISSGKIQAGAIGADQIAAGVISTSKINANDFLLGTGQIADAAITNAKIGTAAVDTLEIASEAVIVPKTYYNQNGYTGSGSTINIPALSFTLPVSTKAYILFNANQAYSGSIPDTILNLYLNGTLISGVSNGGSHATTSPTLAGSASLGAGTHTVYVSWYGASSAVTIGNISLTVLGAMR